MIQLTVMLDSSLLVLAQSSHVLGHSFFIDDRDVLQTSSFFKYLQLLILSMHGLFSFFNLIFKILFVSEIFLISVFASVMVAFSSFFPRFVVLNKGG
ncbi:hypothetical protein MXB_4728, partial [Myxobolus squamalis]